MIKNHIVGITALVVASCLALPAHAADIDFTRQLTELDGKPATDCARAAPDNPQVCAETVPLTLARVVVLALDLPDPAANATDKVSRGVLAQNIYRAKGPVSMTAEEVKTVKDAVAKLNLKSTMLVQVYGLLDPASIKR